MIKNIFFNPIEGRLRAGWRILLFIIITVVIVKLLEFTIDNLFGGLPEDKTLRFFFSILVAAIAGTTAVIIARRYLDKKTVISFGLKLDGFAIKDWLYGFLLSFLMAGSVFLLLLWFGLLEFESFNPDILTAKFMGNFLLMFVAFCILTAWWEELVFRGYLLQNMISGLGKNWAVIISCILYGVLHATNPNAGIISSSIIVLFGFMRLYGYLRTSQLWLSMGMHAGWNFFQGPVFGFGTSGYETESILTHKLNGSDWLTGGKFGPEGSVFTVLIVLLAILSMYWWTRGREVVK
ncbi:lysostaphin resistance A-like protein [Candidatus Neomarinimicrobiota bacterium]